MHNTVASSAATVATTPENPAVAIAVAIVEKTQRSSSVTSDSSSASSRLSLDAGVVVVEPAPRFLKLGY